MGGPILFVPKMLISKYHFFPAKFCQILDQMVSPSRHYIFLENLAEQ